MKVCLSKATCQPEVGLARGLGLDTLSIFYPLTIFSVSLVWFSLIRITEMVKLNLLWIFIMIGFLKMPPHLSLSIVSVS